MWSSRTASLTLLLVWSELRICTKAFYPNAFLKSRHILRRQQSFSQHWATSEHQSSEDPLESTLNVIKRCMGESPEPDGLIIRSTKPGISGFAVDPELGFVVILTNERQQSTFCVVSPQDKQEVRSAEALCMVQMSGGMDLATTVLPPDCLARLVADAWGNETTISSEAIRAHVELLEVHAVDNNDNDYAEHSKMANDTTTLAVPKSNDERDAKLANDVSKLLMSIKQLPGLATCTEDEVLKKMRLHAAEDGSLDRVGFTAVLDDLREAVNGNKRSKSKVKFELVVAVDDEQLRIQAPTVVQALGLAFRYKKEVQVRLQEMEMDAIEVFTRFPKFRPIQELQEDARIMDSFIPSMYSKASTLKADDRAF